MKIRINCLELTLEAPNFLKTIDFFKSIIVIGITTMQRMKTNIKNAAGSISVELIIPKIFHINKVIKIHKIEKPKTIIGPIRDFQK